MLLHAEAAPGKQSVRQADVLLVMVPGMGMSEADFQDKGLIAAVEQRQWRVAIATADPGPDAYLDGSVETRLLGLIADARRAAGVSRVWLAGISLGCQGILRCVRARPDVAEGLLLLTPYLASTGLIAEIGQAGGLRSWARSNLTRNEPDRALLKWLASTPSELPQIMVGSAANDRFAATARLLSELLPAGRTMSVAGEHDWASWSPLWRLMLDQDPFGQDVALKS